MEPGYAGGPSTNSGQVPTYEEVCSGKTGHAEVIKIEFDSSEIKFEDLLTVFFATHDPTTPNQHGADVGAQYRSIILHSNEAQKLAAEMFIEKLNSSTKDGVPIVTEIKPLDKFYEAEDYHKDFYSKNPENPYCQVVINPKLVKLQKEFSNLLKSHQK